MCLRRNTRLAASTVGGGALPDEVRHEKKSERLSNSQTRLVHRHVRSRGMIPLN
jgi:hypothetical protein